MPYSLRLGWPDCLQLVPFWGCQLRERSGDGFCRRCLARAAHSCAFGGLEQWLVVSPAHVGARFCLPALMMSSKETGCFLLSAIVL
jgi:hypothetical protein